MTRKKRKRSKGHDRLNWRHQLTGLDIDCAAVLYEDGLSLNTIALIYGTSREWMRRKLMEGMALRQMGMKHKQKKRSVVPSPGTFLGIAYRYAIQQMYEGQKMSVPRIATKLFFQDLAVRDILLELNIPLRHKAPRRSADASQKVNKAVRRGELLRQPCEVCGDTGMLPSGKPAVVAHHDDYTKPLDVRWLCHQCHAAWHQTHTAIMETTHVRST